MPDPPLRIGTAGWSLPADAREAFGPGSSQLQRYATRLSAVEINSSFYRSHRRTTYVRWAASVPADFRFSVKLPRTITQYARLRDTDALVEAFVGEASGLGPALGCVLVQLPPSLAFDATLADRFFVHLRGVLDTGVLIACEPRHASWQSTEADALWLRHGVSRVAADPPRFAGGEQWAGAPPPYLRWHGSPQIYRDPYTPAQLDALARALEPHADAWVIFDNTAQGHATTNALQLVERLRDATDGSDNVGQDVRT